MARQWLERQIGRRWRCGERLPTISELSETLGVGQVNVHRAVRELAREGWLVSRPRAGTFVADPLPRRRRTGGAVQDALHKHVVLLTFNTHFEQMIHRIITGFRSRLGPTGCSLHEHVCHVRDTDCRGRYPEADALVLINPNPQPEIYFDNHQVMVAINTAVETPIAMPGRFDVVSVEQEHGGWLAGQRLHRAGVEAACFIGVCADKRSRGVLDGTSRMRLEGFERGLGRAVAPAHRLAALSYNIDTGAEVVEAYLRLDPRPAGVFAASDELAVGFITGAATHGLTAGRDYQIIGFDGQQIGRSLHGGPLTTIDVPGEQMGARAAELLLDRLAHPRQRVHRLQLGCRLFEGVTVRDQA